jgi:hypothetical protein
MFVIFPLDPTKLCTTCQYVGTNLLENILLRGKFYIRKEKDSTGKNIVQLLFKLAVFRYS